MLVYQRVPPIVQKDVRHKTHPRGSMEGMKPAPWGGAWLAHRGDVEDLPCGILLVMIKD